MRDPSLLGIVVHTVHIVLHASIFFLTYDYLLHFLLVISYVKKEMEALWDGGSPIPRSSTFFLSTVWNQFPFDLGSSSNTHTHTHTHGHRDKQSETCVGSFTSRAKERLRQFVFLPQCEGSFRNARMSSIGTGVSSSFFSRLSAESFSEPSDCCLRLLFTHRWKYQYIYRSFSYASYFALDTASYVWSYSNT